MAESTARKMPKGGRKGGTTFPRLSLKESFDYAKKLVAKTHTGPQPASIVYPGVFGVSAKEGGEGDIRKSALLQFGWLKGNREGMIASDFAKKAVAMPENELPAVLRVACLQPKLYKSLFDTYQGSETTKAKIKQQAAALKVHPEVLDDCLRLFVESLEFAKLATVDGEAVKLLAVQEATPPTEHADDRDAAPSVGGDVQRPDSNPVGASEGGSPVQPPSARSVIHVNVNLDSSLDTEKLERQLELLRRYGAI